MSLAEELKQIMLYLVIGLFLHVLSLLLNIIGVVIQNLKKTDQPTSPGTRQEAVPYDPLAIVRGTMTPSTVKASSN